MGACQSEERKELRNQTTLSNRIDNDLKKKDTGMKQKLLLLGPGESGKSTCLKQMKILHHNGFTELEVKEKMTVVFINIVQSMGTILTFMEEQHLIGSSHLEPERKLIRKMEQENLESFPGELKRAIKQLWDDDAVQEAFARRNEYHITESAQYFFENIDRIATPDYRPTSQDILHTRVPTTGVVQVYFTVKGINFEVFDVGGQRSERRKWIHCFDDCKGVIFVVAISEFDQVIREDNMTNRLLEALELFAGIANSQYFTSCSMILFLNKKDIFLEKIKDRSIKSCFKEYSGNGDYESSVRYIRKKFEHTVKSRKKPYTHETCATDTNQVTVVINSVIDTIVQENLKDTGMI